MQDAVHRTGRKNEGVRTLFCFRVNGFVAFAPVFGICLFCGGKLLLCRLGWFRVLWGRHGDQMTQKMASAKKGSFGLCSGQFIVYAWA